MADSCNTSFQILETREQTETRQAEENTGRQLNPLLLPYVMMSELRYLPECSGIYFAIEESGEVVYIGQSVNIRSRWRAHHVQGELCDLTSLEAARRVRLAWLEMADGLDGAERALIRQFRPRLNRTHNCEPKLATQTKPERKPAEPSTIILRRYDENLLTARQFAEAVSKPYPTVMSWLQTGKVPGAKLVESPIGSYYEIPSDAVSSFEPPKRGRPGKAASETKAAPAKKRAGKKAGN